MSEAIFGKYRLVAELGHGGMADVYLAVARGPVGFNKLTVIKRLKENLVEDPEFVSMLLDEARLAARLNHPNVVQTIEVGEEGKQYFIAMEYLDGQPFHRVVVRSERKKKLPLAMSLRIIADVLSGLHYAHELTDYDGAPLNVVHRDATPHNVFVTYDGQVKVVDFGIAKAANRESETRTGIVKGKVTYMGPEHAMGQGVDRRADVFSIGVMLWEAAAGTRMWKNVPDLAIVQRLITGDIPKLRDVKPDVPDELARIIDRAVAPKPAERYASALEFQNDLEKYIEASGERASNREIGQFVSDLFADRRAELRTIIETQLADLKTSTKSFKPVRIEVESPPSLEGEGPTSSSNSGPLTATALSASRLLTGEAGRGPTSDATAVSADSRRSDASTSKKSSGSSPVPYVAVALLAGAGIAWLAFGSRKGADTASAATSAQAVVAPPTATATASAAAEPAKITLTLKANPAEARFRLDDGAPLPNPFIGQFPKDSAKHTILVEAPGYKTKTTEIQLLDDVLLDLALEREAAAKTPTRTVVVTRPAATPAATATPNTKPKRHIDTDDPWH
jgi:serine/threonine-protein kinase